MMTKQENYIKSPGLQTCLKRNHCSNHQSRQKTLVRVCHGNLADFCGGLVIRQMCVF